ncbi:MAG TPA: capsid cement protein [Opitutaceae bacterium]
MNTIALIVSIVAIFAALVWLVASRPHGRALTFLANVAEGFQPAKMTFLADAAISTRYLLVKPGSDSSHVALCGTGDIPLGIATDEPSAAEEGVSVNLLGVQSECQIGVASAEILAGALIVSAASGKLRTLPTANGTYYIIGRALKTAAGDGDLVEFVPCFPTQRVVAT